MIAKFLGSLGLFIYGMKQMSEGLQKTAGKRLRHFLAKLTNKSFKGVLVGTGITAIVQSSSATTVMIVGFVNAGLMTLFQAVGVIMGANIGTTVTAQVVSFQLGDYAYHAIALGGFTFLFSGKKKLQYLGQVLLGFGLLFLGLNTMGEAVAPLRDSVYFVEMVESFSRYPILGVVAGMIVTIAVQSSTATFGIVVGLVSAGIINYQAGIPVLLGMNVGTTVTAILSSIGTNLSARRAAAAHCIFNFLGSGIILSLLYLIPDFAGRIESLLKFTSSSLGFGQTMAVNRLLANTHSLFNITNTLIWLPFVGFMVRVVKKIIPGQDTSIKRGLIYLDERMLETPGVVMEQVKNELSRMHRITREMLEEVKPAILNKDLSNIQSIRHKEEIINEIEEELIHFLTRVSQGSLSEEDMIALDMYFSLIDDIENIGDDVDALAELSVNRDENNIEFSDHAVEELEKIFDYVYDLSKKSIELIETEDINKYPAHLIEAEEEIDDLQQKYRNEHMNRLNEGTCDPNAGIIYLEALEDLEHISDQFSDIAQCYLEREQELKEI